MTYGTEGPTTRALSNEKLLNSEIHEHLLKSQKKTSFLRESTRSIHNNNKNTHRRTQSYTFDINYLTKSKVNLNLTVQKEQQQTQPIRKSICQRVNQRKHERSKLEDPPLIHAFFTYLSYTILRWFGNLRDLLRVTGIEKRKGAKDNNTSDFAPLFNSFENFFTQNMYMRGRDCFNRPISGVPGAQIDLVDRNTKDYNWSFYNTGKTIKAYNMGSYNYLGFAQNSGDVTDSVLSTIKSTSVASCSPRQEIGTLKCQLELEQLVAKYLNKEKAITFGMGFATNAVNIPALVDKKCLIMSDELNHVSLILGARLSGAHVKVFKHNQPKDLEQKLRNALIEGHPLTRRPYKKVLILVEGIYSMEGTILNLPEIISIKKKYKAYLYLDEAHSIGALGKNGRGICEYWGVNEADVDVLMGTFSKSFGAAGGYIAGSTKLINYLMTKSHAQVYASSMSPPVCMQIIKTLSIIMGLDGTMSGQSKIKQLKENCIYFREMLVNMGFIVYGDSQSPIVPVMIYLPAKCLYFSRLMLERNIAVVSVGFPATSLVGGRIRFCVSASHTKEMLDEILNSIDECGYLTGVKFSGRNQARTMKEIRDEADQAASLCCEQQNQN